MSVFKFAVVLNLSNYFSDHRHRVRICIDDRIKTVKDLHDKITTIFGVKNFILTSRNEYLPHTEDIGILHSDDIIWVIPSDNSSHPLDTVNTTAYITSKADKKHPPEDNTVNTTAYITSKADKKRKSSILKNHEDICPESNGLGEIVNDELQIDVKKKKKKHSIDVEKEIKIKKDKKHKKKYKDYESDAEESQNVKKRLKSLDYTQEKTKDPIVKNRSCPVENPYVNPDLTINVATSSPFSIPCKKAASVSTNTNKYLKENKINIVKIDYIKRPSSELKQNEEADATTCQTQMEVVDEPKSLENNVTDIIISESSTSNKEVVEELPNKEVEPSFDYKKTNKISLYVPTTKYFFLNTPSNENRVKPKPAKKRENFFKLKEGLFSPVAIQNNPVDDVEQVVVDDVEQVVNENETNIISTSQIAIDNTKMLQEENTVNKHDEQIIKDYVTNEIDEKSDADISTVISETGIESSGSKEVFGELTRSILEDSCYIDKITPCDTSILDNSGTNYNTSSISGVTPFSFSSTKKRYVSGVGQLLTSLRESETNNTLDREPNSDSNEFVTKRRHRTRKRQKKSNNLVEDTTTFKPTPQVTGTIKQFTAPKMHIKFSENLENDKSEVMEHTEEYSGYNENTNVCDKTDRNKNESSTVCMVNESDYMKSLEESVHQLPIMSQRLPKIGDVISFKVLKISDDFTPGISSDIVGNVTQFSPESKVVTFKITTGIEQLQAPKGKFSLDQEDDHSSSSNIKEILWADLIKPKLLYP